MYIHLKWVNKNTQPVTVNIYRSITTIDRANPGTPLVTLDGTVEEYYDRTVAQGSNYYYMLQFVNGTNKVSSRNMLFNANYLRGPGNNLVLFGDDDHGFMGYGTFPSMNAVLNAIEVGRETDSPVNDYSVSYYKFSVDGEVYYFLSVSSSLTNNAKALAFTKRAAPIPITLDGVSYLAFVPNYRGTEWVQVDYAGGKPPAGDRSLACKLTVPLIDNLERSGVPGEALGCFSTVSRDTKFISAAPPEADRFMYWILSDTMGWTTSMPITFSIALKLVE